MIDWWNGGRIFLYDDETEVKNDLQNDQNNQVQMIDNAPCYWSSVYPGHFATTKVFSTTGGLPETDHSQLLEYTFADAITANGLPYPIQLENVGYNISSVDQIYLPVAIGVNLDKLVPYIGTVEDIPTFRSKIEAFLQDFPGWPQFKPLVTGNPRVPGAFNVFTDSWTAPLR